jgi:hypothetical protein
MRADGVVDFSHWRSSRLSFFISRECKILYTFPVLACKKIVIRLKEDGKFCRAREYPAGIFRLIGDRGRGSQQTAVPTAIRNWSRRLAVFSLKWSADDHIFSRSAVVTCLRTAVPLRPGETSCIQRMVESVGQKEMARTKSLHDTLLANAASLEPADAS